MPKYLKSKDGSLESAVLEAVSAAQQAAIAISKKEKGEKPKKEELSAKQKELDVDNDGDIGADDLAALRKKAKKEGVDIDEGRMKELHGYMEKGMSAQEIAKKMKLDVKTIEALMDEKEPVAEKVEYVEYKFKNKNDAMKAKAYFDGIQLMSFDVNDDGASQGELAVDAGSKDMTKYHKEVMKKFRPKVMTQEKKEEVKEEKDMSGMCCKHCGDMFGKPTAESSCTYDAYDPMGENWIPKEQYESKKKVNEMVEAAANAISDMWREAAKVEPKKEEEEEPKDGKTMTGKPMSKVEIAAAKAEKEK